MQKDYKSLSEPRTVFMPRPDFYRNEWINLNGEWEFSFDNPSFDRIINVPFCYECKKSGINTKELHNTVWYRKQIWLDISNNDCFLLHFEAVDYQCFVWVNNHFVGSHIGGQTSFSFDISKAVDKTGNQLITVMVNDYHQDLDIARGKQFWEIDSKHIFYTHTMGIWKNVWIEKVTDIYFTDIHITPKYDEKEVEFSYQLNQYTEGFINTVVRLDDVIVYQGSIRICGTHGSYVIKLNQTLLKTWNFYREISWRPDNPRLFDVDFNLIDTNGRVTDKVGSYFGFRKISVSSGKLLFNNQPIILKMILDQGYWPDSLMTPENDEQIIRDILLIKQMGFNGVRIHQKVECQRFLYFADKMGLLVFGEIGNAFDYSFFYATEMYKEWIENVTQNYNHPCIVAWVPLNESWGIPNAEHNAMEAAHIRTMYELTKSLDNTRLVIDNDGWDHVQTDLCTIHDYEKDPSVFAARYANIDSILSYKPEGNALYIENHEYCGEPILLTEFGGVSISSTDQSEKDWGYSQYNSKEELFEHLREIFNVLKRSPNLCGYCYTQFTDIEYEKNGLLSYDRTPKLKIEKIAELNAGIGEAHNLND